MTELTEAQEQETELPALDIVFEDDDFIAINKPAGLLVHPSWIAPRKTPNATSMLKKYLNGATVHTIHRLDRATSGILLFGKRKESAKALNEQFASREVSKTYMCMVRGYTPEELTIDYPLKEILDKKADKFADPDKPAQDAVTAFRRIATLELPIPVSKYPAARYSLLEVSPVTGRKHQIRRHMKHIFHPIVGDTKYGDGKHNRLFREHFNLHRLMLMATSLTFTHPVTQQRMTLRAPVTQEVADLFRQWGWPVPELSEQLAQNAILSDN